MDGDTFDDLLHIVGAQLEKQDTSFKEAIPAEERLAVTLYYLATGGKLRNLTNLFRIPVSTLVYLIPETCQVIYEQLKDKQLKLPSTEQEWKTIQEKFQEKWQFPQCLGAMDGKHVKIQCPGNSGSLYRCYKEFFSIVLFAIVDANYRFIYHEVGAPGIHGDATIWNKSPLKKALEENRIGAPGAVATPDGRQVPSLIVADSAFALSPNLMKPFPEKGAGHPEKIFNYRLSRARRIVENAFGHLAQRFGIYQTTIRLGPKKVKKVVLATLVIHNFLRDHHDQIYCGPGSFDCERQDTHEYLERGQWRQTAAVREWPGLRRVEGGQDQRQFLSGNQVRNTLMDWFLNEGAVPWQDVQANA